MVQGWHNGHCQDPRTIEQASRGMLCFQMFPDAVQFVFSQTFQCGFDNFSHQLEATPARAPENIDTNDEFLFLHPVFSAKVNKTMGLPARLGNYQDLPTYNLDL